MNRIEIFRNELTSLLNNESYTQAKEKINETITGLSKDDEDYEVFLSEAAGFLIDIGTESNDRKLIEEGIDILKKNEEIIRRCITEDSYYYCLGNGIQSLYKIEQKKTLPTLLEIKKYLSEAKNFYYKAFKIIDLTNIDHLALSILTSLGNNLSLSGRIIEAINLHRTVLKIDTAFTQSLIGYAEGLDYLNRLSANSHSVWLYSTIYHGFKQGLESKIVPSRQKQYFENQLSKYKDLLSQHSYNFLEYDGMKSLYQKEFELLTPFERFCNDNYLRLNEQSLFCNCEETSIDNLSIIHSKITLYGDKIGRLELLLNRLKAEFGLARKLYYEGLNDIEIFDEIVYSDLMDGECIGYNTEKIRTAFRLCFGIFDKIAHGICYFFDLPKKKNEHIYFNSFWESEKCPERWNALKDLRNPHLVALFCMANDFNYKQGEFSFYKEWRNKLEHNNLILVDRAEDPDLFKLFEDDAFVSKIATVFFKEQALHLLKICCAAIYSYVFAIRTESLNPSDDRPTVPFIIQPKHNY